jgi:DNA-binding NtrC family response regulator
MAHILVVDDDQSVAAAFERFLAHEGHHCTVASNAEDAMRLVGECDPDLVVMDIRMPGVDRLEALKTLRSRHPDVYVALMTAYGTSQTSIDAFRSGAFEYLTKPLDPKIGPAFTLRRCAWNRKEAYVLCPGLPSPHAFVLGSAGPCRVSRPVAEPGHRKSGCRAGNAD